MDEAMNYNTEAILKNASSNFFSSFVFLSKEKKQALKVIYAFCHLADSIADSKNSQENKRELLNELNNEIDNCYKETPVTQLGSDIVQVVRNYNIDKQVMSDLIKGVMMDIAPNRFQSFKELQLYCYHVAGTVGIMCVSIFLEDSLKAREFAVSLATALQLTNILRDIKEDYLQDRIYLPLEDFEKFGYSVEELNGKVLNVHYFNWINFQVERAQSFYNLAADQMKGLYRKDLVSAEVMGQIYYRILKKIRTNPSQIFKKRINLLKIEKIYIAAKSFCQNRTNKKILFN